MQNFFLLSASFSFVDLSFVRRGNKVANDLAKLAFSSHGYVWIEDSPIGLVALLSSGFSD